MALNIGRLAAKVANIDSFQVELECVEPDDACDIAPLLAFKKSNKLASV